jgi:hypothetical protein
VKNPLVASLLESATGLAGGDLRPYGYFTHQQVAGLLVDTISNRDHKRIVSNVRAALDMAIEALGEGKEPRE